MSSHLTFMLFRFFAHPMCCVALLQAVAIHVAAQLETRCLVHQLMFDKLIEHVGLETGALATAAAGGVSQLQPHVTTNITNVSHVLNSPHTSVTAEAAPVTSVSNDITQLSHMSQEKGSSKGGIVGVFLGVAGVASAGFGWLLALLGFIKDVILKLLLLRAAWSASKAATAIQQQAAGRSGVIEQPAMAAAARPNSQVTSKPATSISSGHAAAGAAHTADQRSSVHLPHYRSAGAYAC